jgi:glutaryl-CoA dehydrogenase (non-decarboxylating)
MIDFDLTEEQRLLEQTVREWGRREVAPRIKELDRAPHLRSQDPAADGGARVARISVPVEYGGAGMDYVALGLASEELEYVDTSLRVIMSVHAGLNCLSLLTGGRRSRNGAIWYRRRREKRLQPTD